MEEITKRPLMDSLIDNKELQILKTIIPYMPDSQQKTCAIVIRFIELIKTTALFETSNVFTQELQACSCDTTQERMQKMLGAVREFCTEKEQEQIDMIINFYEV